MAPQRDSNRSLVVRSGEGGLQQQGSIDWVKLAGSTVNFTIESLARFSNAGIEALTVCAAEALFSRLVLSQTGEMRMQAAISQLSAFSSFNNALWFGFGVKHVIRRLAESSEGLNCIAVCAALSEGYCAVDSAKILRTSFVRCNAPKQLTPTLKQWVSLIEACEGALAPTDFGVKIHDISRLCLPDGIPNLRLCSEPEAIADALEGIIRVSNGSQERIQLIGGADCGWIAAFSTWLLDLSVEIRNSSGQSLYRSNSSKSQSRDDAQVVVIYGNSASTSLQIMKTSFVIPNGRLLVHEEETHPVRDSHLSALLSYGRVPWSSALQDTFGNRITALLYGGLSANFGTALGCAARLFSSIVANDPAMPESYYARFRMKWRHLNSSSHGQGFVNIIRRQLPEIAGSEAVMGTMQNSLATTLEEAITRYEQTMFLIAAACSCHACQVSPESNAHDPKKPFCQVILVEVVTELVQIISAISMKVEILPTRAGIEKIYWDRFSLSRTGEKINYVTDGLLADRSRHPLTSAKNLFSGRGGANMFWGHSAAASSGICCYMDTLVKVSANLEECHLIHITPGRIEWDSNIYEEVTDFRRDKSEDSLQYEAKICPLTRSTECVKLDESSSPDIICDFLIEEKGYSHPKSIWATYRFTTALGRFYFGPFEGAEAVASALSGADCKGRECAEIPPFDVMPIQGEGLIVNRGELSPVIVPFVRVLPKRVEAQWVALSQDNYVATSGNNQTSYKHDKYVHNLLQGNQCLYCLLMSAIRGPCSKHRISSTRNVCIVSQI